ncbi:MAG: SPOR domain-containing protein [Candidatus Rokubacteria bacterium]|nr:SPOR domain-containing protein [Candidatus Rokubacteria bacterium]
MAVRGGKRGGGGRVGAMLVLVGLVGVLGGTFGLGFLTGRHWPRVQVMLALARPTARTHTLDVPSPPASSGPKAHSDKAGSSTETTGAREATGPPRLTFYQELTAPLSDIMGGPDMAPQTPQRSHAPRGTRGAARAADSVSEFVGGVEGASNPPERDATRESAESRALDHGARGDGAGQRFMIQVAAYGTPSQAQALRGRLAAKGLDAAVSEVATSSGTRWRVRVGTYTSRDDARAAAERLATQMRVDPMVVRDTRDGGR